MFKGIQDNANKNKKIKNVLSNNGITADDFEMDVAVFSDYDSEKKDELVEEKNNDSDDDVVMDLTYITLGFE